MENSFGYLPPGGVDEAEPDNDDEPSMGSANATISGSQTAWSAGNDDDREDDPAENGIGDEQGLAEQTIGEPSLGSFDRMTDQTKSYRCDHHHWWGVPLDAELDRFDYEPCAGDEREQDADTLEGDGDCDREPDFENMPGVEYALDQTVPDVGKRSAQS